jgi:hypothetical protein
MACRAGKGVAMRTTHMDIVCGTARGARSRNFVVLRHARIYRHLLALPSTRTALPY